MSVYVDSLVPCIPSKRWPFSFSCHLFADTEFELSRMAGKLGLKRSWYQTGKALSHYDLTSSKRRRAIELGAIQLGRREVAEKIRYARAQREAVLSGMDEGGSNAGPTD